MIAPTIALHVALASANIAGSAALEKGQAVVTRLGHPFCADPLDLQRYFAAVERGDEAAPSNVGSCSPLQARHQAVVIGALPNRGVVKVKVFIGQRTVAGFMTTAGVRAP